MKKVAILDDELIARNQLSSLLQNIPQIEVTLSTSDPYQLLNYLEASFIDILFLDMNMPIMNGIELLGQLTMIDQNINIIVVSGYADFSYAQGSIKYGVGNYLLKHELSEESLMEALKKCISDDQQLVDTLNIKKEYRAIDLFRKKEANKQKAIVEQWYPSFIPSSMMGMIVLPTNLRKKLWSKEQYKIKSSSFLEELINDSLIDGCQSISTVMPKGELFILFSFAGLHSRKEVTDYIDTLIQKLRATAKRLLDVELYIEMSVLANDFAQVMKIFESKERLLNNLFYSQKNERFYFNPLTIFEKEYDQTKINFYLSQVYFYTKYYNKKLVLQQVTFIFDYMKNKKLEKEKVLEIAAKIDYHVSSAISEHFNQSPVKSDIQFSYYQNYDTFYRLEEELFETLELSLINFFDKIFENCDPVVKSSVDFIHKMFMNDIRLQDCADEIHVNYTYLSRIFKQQWRISFNKYLNQVRIDQAKIYLLYQDYTVSQVAELCGNLNYNYFFRIFKEATGFSPNAFSENFKIK